MKEQSEEDVRRMTGWCAPTEFKPQYEEVGESPFKVSMSDITAQLKEYQERLLNYQQVTPMVKVYTEKDVRFAASLTQKFQAVEALSLKPMEKPFEEEEEKYEPPLGQLLFNSRHYSRHMFTDTKRLVAEFKERESSLPEYDTFIGTGLSGSIAAAILGHETGKMFAAVRKPGVEHHSNGELEGRVGAKWLLIDDFISSGRTARRVFEVVSKRVEETTCVGGWMYDHDEFIPVTRFSTKL